MCEEPDIVEVVVFLPTTIYEIVTLVVEVIDVFWTGN